MFKYYSKSFTDPKEIDKWLNGFTKAKLQAEYNFNIVGYVSVGSSAIITIKVFENEKVELKQVKRNEKEK